MSDITLKSVTKLYGQNAALMDVSLTFQDKMIYTLLGRNGAGKSTLLGIMSNRVIPSCGEVLYGELPISENDEALKNIYCMSDVDIFSRDLRFSDAIDITRIFYPETDKEYALKLCEKFSLDPRKRLLSLSTGYKSIGKSILALASNAEAILLDEPVLGLDANHRERLYAELLDKYINRPALYIISTHLVEEAAKLVERAVIIKDGRLLTDSTVEELCGSAYTVTGAKDRVDEYVQDKEFFGETVMAGLKSVYVKGKLPEKLPPQLEAGKPELQQLFIHMTE